MDAALDERTRAAFRAARVRAFAMSWTAYVAFYLCRYNWSVAKSAVGEEYGLGMAELARIEFWYLLAYTAGQFCAGWLGDRLGSRRVIGWGLIASAACNLALGQGQGLLFFLAGYGLNGAAQAGGWPGCTKVFSQWFARAERGSTMGFWSTCYQLGIVISKVLATFLLVTWGWRWAFFGPALLVAGYGLLVLGSLPGSPRSLGLPTVEDYYQRITGRACPPEPDAERGSWADSLAVLRSRDLWTLGATYFVIKFIRYSFVFWLPYFLEKGLGYGRGEAGYTATALGVGGTLGAIAAGVASDRLFDKRRAPIVAIMLALLAAATSVYAGMGAPGRLENVLAIALIGFLIFGPDSIVAGVAAVDFGTRRAAAFAAGFVNGMGSFGAVAQELALPWVRDRWGWDAVFLLFTPLAIAGALLVATMWDRRPPGEAHQAGPG